MPTRRSRANTLAGLHADYIMFVLDESGGMPRGLMASAEAALSGQWLSERLGQSFIVENRPGAAGTIAVDSVVRSPPDGYTLLLTSANDAYNESLYPVRFKYIRDIAPVASIALTPSVMEVNPSFPAMTVPEFIAYAKANPGKLNYASGCERVALVTARARKLPARMY